MAKLFLRMERDDLKITFECSIVNTLSISSTCESSECAREPGNNVSGVLLLAK